MCKCKSFSNAKRVFLKRPPNRPVLFAGSARAPGAWVSLMSLKIQMRAGCSPGFSVDTLRRLNTRPSLKTSSSADGSIELYSRSTSWMKVEGSASWLMTWLIRAKSLRKSISSPGTRHR